MDILADILTVTRLTGQVAWHTWTPKRWGLAFPAAPVVWFHIVGAGTAKLVPAKGKLLELGAQDLVLLPHGTGHALCDDPRTPRMALHAFEARLPKLTRPARPHAELVCGRYTLAFAEIHPVLRLLPAIIHVPGATLRGNRGLQATLELLLRELTDGDVGSERVVSRLLEVIFVLVLRHWLDVNADRATGWLGALRDEPIGRALVEIHLAPARDWSVAELARAVGMSRPVFARRFASKVGETPLGYLRKLRIDLATVLLLESDQSLAAIAQAVGYTSEFAFNRAFQRARGLPPGRFRRARAGAP